MKKNEKKLVVFFTSGFPYGRGEQFIENEIEYWSHLPWANVVVFPDNCSGKKRFVPDDIDIFLSKRTNKLLFILNSIFSFLFWKEILHLHRVRKLRIKTLRSALASTTAVLSIKRTIKKFAKKYGKIDLAYTYWNENQAYAVCLSKREGIIHNVVSRAHGWDVYEHRHSHNHAPLKRQFINDFDKTHVVSQAGYNYFISNYAPSPDKLIISRLGVMVPHTTSRSSNDGTLRFVSVSFCIAIKRIDKIVSAIREFSATHPDIRVMWTHIGDGPLFQEVQRIAQIELGALTNISFEFLGKLENHEVLAYYAIEPVDIFINLSESEGIPVSIMEAMAYGIPAVAPAIGGIPELINDANGVLLPTNPSNKEIIKGIELLIEKEPLHYRSAARKQIIDNYNADINFPIFIESVKLLALSRNAYTTIHAD